MVDASKDQYLNFGLDGGRLITLDRKEAEDHGPNILRVHAIASDRSVDPTSSGCMPIAIVSDRSVGLPN